MNYKHFLIPIVVLISVIIACSKDSTSSNTTTPTPSTNAVGTTGVSAVAMSSPTACASKSGVEKIVCLCNELKASLNSSQVAALQLDYTFSNIKTWSNLPASMSSRLGIRLGDLNATQVGIAKAIIKEMTGSNANEGYAEVEQLWMADDYLNGNGGGATYGSGNYYLAFFGTPAMTGQFEIMMTGHHKTVANTYKDGAFLAATPHFVAVEPLTFNSYSPVTQEKNAFANLIAGLDATQLASAKSSSTFSDLVLTPAKNWQFPTTYSGLVCSGLSASQKELVRAAIKTYTDDIDDVNGTAMLNKYMADIDKTYITYSGTGTFDSQNDYIRIDGPNVWIEFSVQRGVIMSGVHYHSVWRDRILDYGSTQ